VGALRRDEARCAVGPGVVDEILHFLTDRHGAPPRALRGELTWAKRVHATRRRHAAGHRAAPSSWLAPKMAPASRSRDRRSYHPCGFVRSRHASLRGEPVNQLRQLLAQALEQVVARQAGLRRQRVDLVRAERVPEIVRVDVLVLAGTDPGLGDVAVAGVLQLLEDIVEATGEHAAGGRATENAAKPALEDVAEVSASRTACRTARLRAERPPEQITEAAKAPGVPAQGASGRTFALALGLGLGLSGTPGDAAGPCQHLVGEQPDHRDRKLRHVLLGLRLALRGPAGRCALADRVEDIEQ